MKRVIPRVRSLTIASDGPGALWSLSFLLRTFRTLHNIEHLTVATTDHISENSQFWNAIDAICGSTRTYGLLETVEFCFSSVRPASGAEYMRIEELGEKLPYLVEHGMLKVSDPKAYVFFEYPIISCCTHLTSLNSQRDGLDTVLTYCTVIVLFLSPVHLGVQSKDMKQAFIPCLYLEYGDIIETRLRDLLTVSEVVRVDLS